MVFDLHEKEVVSINKAEVKKALLESNDGEDNTEVSRVGDSAEGDNILVNNHVSSGIDLGAASLLDKFGSREKE